MFDITSYYDDNKNKDSAKPASLEFDPAIEFIGSFELIRNKSSLNLVLVLKGKYGNKKLVSSVNMKSWEKTRSNLAKSLEQKQVSSQDIALITDILDNNCDVIFDILNKDGSDMNDPDDSDLYEDREMSKDWVIAEIENAKENNKGITFEAWKEGLQVRYETMTYHNYLGVCNIT